jgi:hypothetical protein
LAGLPDRAVFAAMTALVISGLAWTPTSSQVAVAHVAVLSVAHVVDETRMVEHMVAA